ncbi:S8 family serine peptidase [Pseudomonas sp. CAM1A]|uniref:S8 family serine peptidase n=1 Tax=Pseudomonas sp. CAM1A TaxID=3231717 RepID=UPI0039C63394
MAKLGPLLRNVLSRIESSTQDSQSQEMQLLAAHVGGAAESGRLPVVVKMNAKKARAGESWLEFKERFDHEVSPFKDAVSGGKARSLYLAGSLAAAFKPERLKDIAQLTEVDLIELDPVVNPTLMDDATIDVGLDNFRNQHGPLTGAGVRVAVLDSGIDMRHPFLAVADSVSTCGEDYLIPGYHGTHCAGSIASRDPIYRGIAPDVELINVKVLRQDGSGQHTSILQGVDAALDRQADIISMSLGFNHLPAWADGGHGWACADGHCPLCTAVDNASMFGAIVCVAAGNEHMRAEALRRMGYGSAFDTEVACPGHSRSAITVGAITKRTFLPAEFSSRGPTAYGLEKPDLVAPGVNIMSTIPAPRMPDGSLAQGASRSDLFGRLSGTSMATPIVAGVAALVLQHRRLKNLSTSGPAMRKAILSAVTSMALPVNVVGAGRINLA